MRTVRNAIKRNIEMPVEKVELKGVYLLLQEIRDDITRLSYQISALTDQVDEISGDDNEECD